MDIHCYPSNLAYLCGYFEKDSDCYLVKIQLRIIVPMGVRWALHWSCIMPIEGPITTIEVPITTIKGPSAHSDNPFYNSFQIENNTLVVTVFLLIMNQTDFHLVHNQKKNCHYESIPFNLKRIRKKCICEEQGRCVTRSLRRVT